MLPRPEVGTDELRLRGGTLTWKPIAGVASCFEKSAASIHVEQLGHGPLTVDWDAEIMSDALQALHTKRIGCSEFTECGVGEGYVTAKVYTIRMDSSRTIESWIPALECRLEFVELRSPPMARLYLLYEQFSQF